MWKRLLTGVFLDGEKGSFGRVFSLPFFVSAWGLSTAAGIVNIVRGIGILDDVITLAAIGMALYTGSKSLSLFGKVSVSKEGQ